MEWTKEQSQAISKNKSNILVAAAAGSGKTAVLVETMIAYPLCIFKEKKLRAAGAILSAVLLLAVTVFVLVQGGTSYDTDVLSSGGSLGAEFDDTYTAEFTDPAFGTCEMRYEENIDAWMVRAHFTKTGETQLILRAPDGTEQVFDLTVGRDTYDISPAAEP